MAYLRVRLIHQCLRQCSQNCPSKRSCYGPASSLIALWWVQHMDSHLLHILLKALIITLCHLHNAIPVFHAWWSIKVFCYQHLKVCKKVWENFKQPLIIVLFKLLDLNLSIYRAQKKINRNSSLPLGQVSLIYSLPWASLSFLFYWFSWQMTYLIPCPSGKWEWKDTCPKENLLVLDDRRHFFQALYTIII